MTLNIFRISAVFSLLGLGAYYFLNQEALVSLEGNLTNALAAEANASLQLEIDKNKSERLIAALYRERSKMRSEMEEVETAVENFKNDIELLEPLHKKNLVENEEVDEELKKVLQRIDKSKIPLGDLESENKPLFENHAKLIEDQKKAEIKLNELTKEADSLNGDLGALSQERNAARSNYESKRTEILSEIKHPGHLYYGDEVTVVVSSKAPSGKGIFIDQGQASGVRDGMVFLATESLNPLKLPMLLTASVVEENFSFLEFVKDGSSAENLSVVDGEKLFLIRSGDLNTSK